MDAGFCFGLAPAVVAKRCGTSPKIIQRDYENLTPLMHVKELVGSDDAALTKLIEEDGELEPRRSVKLVQYAR